MTATHQMKVRLPTRLRSLLMKAAKKNDRPVNQELLHRLDLSFYQQSLLDQVMRLAFGVTIATKLQVIGVEMRDGGNAGTSMDEQLEAAKAETEQWKKEAAALSKVIGILNETPSNVDRLYKHDQSNGAKQPASTSTG